MKYPAKGNNNTKNAPIRLLLRAIVVASARHIGLSVPQINVSQIPATGPINPVFKAIIISPEISLFASFSSSNDIVIP